MNKHLYERFHAAIHDGHMDEQEQSATACSTICLEEMGKFAEWVGQRFIHVGYDCWRDAEGIKHTTPELLSLYEKHLETVNK